MIRIVGLALVAACVTACDNSDNGKPPRNLLDEALDAVDDFDRQSAMKQDLPHQDK